MAAVQEGPAGIARGPAVRAVRLAWDPVAAAVAAEAEAGGGRNL